MDTALLTSWLPALLLGIGLAASSGLNTFLPLGCLAFAAHFKMFGVQLGGEFGWLASDAALVALSAAAIVEVIGDKIPVIDHALDVFGTAARPLAGALATASVFKGDTTTAAIVGLMLGAPSAFGFHAAKASVRAGSSVTTMGVANPVLSTVEDIFAVAISLLAMFSPWLVPVVLIAFGWGLWKLYRLARSRLSASNA